MMMTHQYMIQLVLLLFISVAITHATKDLADDLYSKGEQLAKLGKYEQAALEYWGAILQSPGSIFTVDEALLAFLKMYQRMGSVESGYLFIGKEYAKRRDMKNAISFVKKALEVNSSMTEAYSLLISICDEGDREHYLQTLLEIEPTNFFGTYTRGTDAFARKEYKKSLKFFRKAMNNEPPGSHAAFVSALYLRTLIGDWGPQGRDYYNEMEKLSNIIMEESNRLTFEIANNRTGEFLSPTFDAFNPHMALAYPLNGTLKLSLGIYSAISNNRQTPSTGLKPFNNEISSKRFKYYSKFSYHLVNQSAYMEDKAGDIKNETRRIKVGYVSVNIRSKAIMYLLQELPRFHDKSKFDVHIYDYHAGDDPLYIVKVMRGVDWRQKVIDSVEKGNFHDVSKLSVADLARKIRADEINILVDWDGHSHQGLRPQGLFALQPAPLQINHQEYLSSMGATYYQYIVTDQVVSPISYEDIYTEKFLLMPNCFYANSMIYLKPDLHPPRLSAINKERKTSKFSLCNYNKHLKFDPDTFETWLRVLERLDHVELRLLKNPADGVKNLKQFVKSYNASLLDKIIFDDFLENPFDHHYRIRNNCQVYLDCSIYNSHTTAVDGLYAA